MISLISPATESRHVSWQRLCLAFVLALLLFVLIRWQPEQWLQHEIDQQTRINGIDLYYQALHIEGLSVRMEHASIQTSRLPSPVVLDSLSISPAWSLLLSGTRAVDIKATLYGQSVEAVLVWKKNKYIEIHDLNAFLDVDAFQSLWKQRMPFPVRAGGRLMLSGHIQLDALSGLPVDGQLDVAWQQARIDLPMFNKPLGDYQLGLKAAPHASGVWQWTLGGGTEVRLSGSGQLDLSGKLPQQWTINGRVQIQAAPEAKTIASMLGNQAKTFRISGKLFNARVQ
ncbi:MAG: hypothetical protein Q9M12_03875 [Mariprofundus sp.]|nr:hypothetical protein [Mariprofundus sp.]